MVKESLSEVAAERVSQLGARKQRREVKITHRLSPPMIERGGRTLISFACNDYLGLSRHPDVIAASAHALQGYGAGAGASQLLSGYHPLYQKLEQQLATLKGTESACIFGSGYLANLTVIPSLVGAGDLILADRLSHACMLDGARLSGASVMRFAHNNVEHCQELLRAHRDEHRYCLILTETVFSMDGDRAPLAALHDIAESHHAWLMTDDAHGLGILSMENPAPLQMGTLSKAAAAYGGYLCADANVVDLMRNTGRGYIFSTALPPSVIASASAALGVMEKNPVLCETPLTRARQFTALLGIPEAQSAIVPVQLGDEQRALAASAMLEAEGFYVAAIRPPTVPPGTSRLRFAFCAQHMPEQVERAAALLKQHDYA